MYLKDSAAKVELIDVSILDINSRQGLNQDAAMLRFVAPYYCRPRFSYQSLTVQVEELRKDHLAWGVGHWVDPTDFGGAHQVVAVVAAAGVHKEDLTWD